MSTHVADEPRTSSAAPLQTTVFETDAQLKKHLDRTPASIKQLIIRFSIGAIAALTLVSVFTAFASRRVGTEQAIADAKNATFYIAKGVIETNADDGLLTGDPAAIQRLDDRVHAAVLSGPLVRIKLWADDGTIIYSDQKELIGQKYDLGDDKAEMFATDDHVAEAEVSDLSAPENAYERPFTKLLEVYQLTETIQTHPGDLRGIFHVQRRHQRGTRPVEAVRAHRHRFADRPRTDPGADLHHARPPAAAAQLQRERLLRHAIQASEAERRRIASDLHDGVVQELTGVSFSLAAASRSDSTDAPKMGEASSSIRSSIKSLRSLLVEIYPPNLHEEGLEFALGDLLGWRVQSRYRRKARRRSRQGRAFGRYRRPHVPQRAGSSSQRRQSLGRHPGSTRGQGQRQCRQDRRRRRRPRFHTRADRVTPTATATSACEPLSGLVAEAGGKMSVLSAPGAGTRVEVKLPVLTGGQL